MASNYKKLGPYIREINERNIDLRVTNLLGVSIQKVFMPSIANTVGTDMSKYKIVRKNQFAYGPVTSRNGDKISVALLQEHDEAIISQAYISFELTDHNALDPEYLMMWFRRPEFDRYARFKSHGSARETFDWEEMCDTELPIPSIEIQRALVKEYNTITDRIALNEQLNQKLEETAQTLYRHWFVDFEFPYDFEKGRPSLQGQPYKSSGGPMQWSTALEKEIPKDWKPLPIDTLGKQVKVSFARKKTFNGVEYIGLEHMPKKSICLGRWETVTSIGSNKHAFEKGNILFGKLRPYFHKVGVALVNGICSTDILVLEPLRKEKFGLFLAVLSSNDFVQYASGGGTGTKMPRTSWEYMSDFKLPIPIENDIVELFNNLVVKLQKRIEINAYSTRELIKIKAMILSKMSTTQTSRAGGVTVY